MLNGNGPWSCLLYVMLRSRTGPETPETILYGRFAACTLVDEVGWFYIYYDFVACPAIVGFDFFFSFLNKFGKILRKFRTYLPLRSCPKEHV